MSSARVPFWMIVPWCRIAMRSASCSASSRYCVVSSTVVPCPASCLTVCHTSMRACGVEPGGRFVEEDDRRVADQAHRDVEPASHAARVRRRLAVARVGEREAGEQVVGDRARVLQVTQLGDQHEVLPAGEHLVDRGELAGQADRLAHVAGLGGDVEAVDRGGARVGLEQRRQDPHERGLAGAVRAEQREDAPRRHVEVDAAQHVQVLEGLLDALHPDGGLRWSFLLLSLGVLDRLGQARALLVDPLLAGVGLRRRSRRTPPGRRRRSSRTGVPSAAARSHRSARSPNIVHRGCRRR